MGLDVYYLEETDSICSNRVIITLSEKGITDWKLQKDSELREFHGKHSGEILSQTKMPLVR